MVITLKDIRNFSVLMVLFMFIFTLLGMEIYAYRIMFSDDDHSKVVDADAGIDGYFPRVSFNGFFNGFITIFIVFIGEDWNAAMYDHTRGTNAVSILFFIFLFVFGNLILLNLFLAILLNNFEEPPGADEDGGKENEANMSESIKVRSFRVAKHICMCYCCRKNKE